MKPRPSLQLHWRFCITASEQQFQGSHAQMVRCQRQGGDEPLPLGVPAHATSNQLDRVARMLDAGGSFAARDLGLFVWVSCGAGV
jgi:hypothetical protein